MPRSPSTRGQRPAAPPLSSERRRARIHAMLLPLGMLGAVLGFAATAAIDFAERTVDFAVRAVEVPATVVGVHHGSPEVRFTVGRDLTRTAVASGHYEPGSPLDITLYRHPADETVLSVHHPLANHGWFPVAVLLLVTVIGAVLTVRQLCRFRLRLRIAAHERGGGRVGRALWRPVLSWAAPAILLAGTASAILVLVSNASDPDLAWTGIGFALYACSAALAVEAWLIHAEYAPAPVRPPDPGPQRAVPLLAGTLIAVFAGGMLTIIGLAVHDDLEDRLAGHETLLQPARIVDASISDSARSGCGASLILTYEVDGLSYTSSARTDCTAAEEAVRFAYIEVLRSADDPSLVALPESVR